MAGRPLRRLRNALRLNPLVGWEDLSGMSPAQAFEPKAGLVKPGVSAKYKEVYNRVGLPLAVVLHPDLPESDELWTETARRAAQDRRYAQRTGAIVLTLTVEPRSGRPFYSRPWERRGKVRRVAPFTPFMLLHRMGDHLTSEALSDNLNPSKRLLLDISALLFKWADTARFYFEEDGRISRGVDTAAGRMGVLGEDLLSDLWAKWLLTGRIAYSPTEPPPESPEEARFRNKVAENAPQIFRIWYDYLDQNRPMVIPV